MIAAERANLDKLLETELATQDQLALAIRDHTLRSLVDDPSIDKALFQRTDEQLKKLVGDGGAQKVKDALDLQSKKANLAAEITERQEVWGQLRLGVQAPKCTDFGNTAAMVALNKAVTKAESDTENQKKQKVLGLDTLQELERMCEKENKDDKDDIFKNMEGALRGAQTRHQTDLELASTSQKASSNLIRNYKAASKAYTEALGEEARLASANNEKTAPTEDLKKSAKDRTETALVKLKEATAKLSTATDALSIQFLSKERLDSLNAFVDAVTQAGVSGKLPNDANKATVAFVLFPTLVDDAKKSLTDAKAPLALPLLIQRNMAQLQLEAITREVAARDAMQRISQAVVDAIFIQARQLVLAKSEFTSIAQKNEGIESKSVAAAFSSATGTTKQSLYRGAAFYLDALNRLEARRYKLEYQYIAAEHELQLAYAEVNAKQWASLIGSTVDQVAAASAGGIKPDSVVALLNTFGVFYIGRGVNK